MKSYSIICPLRNEIKHIPSLITFLLSIDHKPNEIFMVDGDSDDGTTEFLKQKSKEYEFLKLLINKNQTVPYALNLAIPLCTGEIIIRIDAHSEYDKNYFTSILKTFENTDASIVGGAMRIANGTPFQNAVGKATSTAFGVGNSSFHFENYEGYTDSVYLGAWRKEIFIKTGLFDTKFKRNQDDEFHYRAKSLGYKIYQSRSIISYYYPRDTPIKLSKQYFQYGLYKPMVLKKIKSEVKIRHLVPSLFTLYIISLPVFIVYFKLFAIAPLVIYSVLMIKNATKSSSTKEMILTALCFPIIHLSYGSGFIIGITKK